MGKIRFYTDEGTYVGCASFEWNLSSTGWVFVYDTSVELEGWDELEKRIFGGETSGAIDNLMWEIK